jgi:HD-GYP domain-containing protein (c-di-GMP phosphodiesterase class II)
MVVPLPLEAPRSGYLVVCQRGETLAAHHARLAQINAECLALSLRNAGFHQKVLDDYKATLAALVHTHEADPGASPGHARRVARLSADLGRRFGMTEDEVEAIRLAGNLHDVGMVGLPPDLLGRVGRLPSAEYDLVKQHPQIGAALTAPVEKPAIIAPWILHHHERFDGHGYPAGLAGDAIPQGARIIALAEVFDAMLTSRHYREAMSFGAAMQRLRSLAGSQLDPRLVDAFTEDMTAERWAEVRAESLRHVGADNPHAARSGID